MIFPWTLQNALCKLQLQLFLKGKIWGAVIKYHCKDYLLWGRYFYIKSLWNWDMNHYNLRVIWKIKIQSSYVITIIYNHYFSTTTPRITRRHSQRRCRRSCVRAPPTAPASSSPPPPPRSQTRRFGRFSWQFCRWRPSPSLSPGELLSCK